MLATFLLPLAQRIEAKRVSAATRRIHATYAVIDTRPITRSACGHYGTQPGDTCHLCGRPC